MNPSDPSVSIRAAVPADAATVAELARRTFFDTFAESNDANDLALHLERAYGVAQQEAEINDPGTVTLLAEAAGVAVAYAQVRTGHVPECVGDRGAIELWRLYVAREWHGRGVAQALMERVKQEARARGAKTLWLGVWERNDRARAFYDKCGFVDVGAHVFLFGTDPQTDRVMVSSL
jgi:ribosomal protein S18 acetylase RimI-like enzyme